MPVPPPRPASGRGTSRMPALPKAATGRRPPPKSAGAKKPKEDDVGDRMADLQKSLNLLMRTPVAPASIVPPKSRALCSAFSCANFGINPFDKSLK